MNPVPVFKTAVPLADIARRPSNHNTWDPAKLAELAQAIRVGGFTSVVLLRELEGLDLRYELIDGEHRVEAAAQAGLVVVPALVYPVGTCADDLALAKHVGHNLLRGTVDLGKLAKQLTAAGGLAELGEAAGVSKDWAASLMRAGAQLKVNVDELVDAAMGVDTEALLERTPPSEAPARAKGPLAVEVEKLRTVVAAMRVVLYKGHWSHPRCGRHDCAACTALERVEAHFED